MLKIDLTSAAGFLPDDWFSSREAGLAQARTMLRDHSGPGGDFTGWVRLPEEYDREEFARIQAAAEKIRSDSQVLVVVGIGGSYPHLQGPVGGAVRPGGRPRAHLCHHRRPQGRAQGARRQRGVRDLRGARRRGRALLRPHRRGAAAHRRSGH